MLFQATVAQAKVEAKASVDMNAEGDVEGDGNSLRVVSQMEAQIISLKAELAMALKAQAGSTFREVTSSVLCCAQRIYTAQWPQPNLCTAQWPQPNLYTDCLPAGAADI